MKPRLPKHITYSLLSLSSPIAAVSGTIIYQFLANTDFWKTITPNDNAAGAMMAYTEFVQLAAAVVFGCLLGLSFAVASIRQQKGNFKAGISALFFNAIPLITLLLIATRR